MEGMWLFGLLWLGLTGAFWLGYRFGLAVAWGQKSDRRYEIEEALRRRKESES